MSDIRFSGVPVYPHVTKFDDAPTAEDEESVLAVARAMLSALTDPVFLGDAPNIDDLAATLLALDGLQQCDLAAELARRNPRGADSLSTTIGDAVAATMQPWCELCSLPLDICRGHDLPPGMVIGGPALQLDAPLSPSERFAQNVLQRVADDDCRYQLAWMQ